MPKTEPITTTTSRRLAQPASAGVEPPTIPWSTARPKIHGPRVCGRNHSA
jgi:hypothetical protein